MYIGVDLGGTATKIGIVDENGNIVAKGSVPTRAKDGYEIIVNDMAVLIKKLLSDNNIKAEDIKSIGIGAPGSIDNKKGVVIYSENIIMRNAPVCDEMRKHFDLPVYIDNDANCAALGEFYALDEKDIECFVAITLGTGVGSGIIINGKIYTGFNGVAGEFGHTTIDRNGVVCNCGRKGCWENYASATALIRETVKAADENPDSLLAKLISENDGKANGKIPFDAAKAGDEVGIKVVNEYIENISVGLVDVINILRPETIVIGGGISNEGESILKPIKDYVYDHAYAIECTEKTDIRIAKLRNDAGIIGAAFLGK